jgi:hypothetical protein
MYIRAVDNASNYQVAITTNVTYDATPPVASIIPLPLYSNTDFIVSWSGSDAVSGIKYYTVQYAEGGGGYQNWLVETNSISATWYISNTTEGAVVYFKVIVYDKAFNTKESLTTYTTKDSLKPISGIVAPEEGYTTNATPIKIGGGCYDPLPEQVDPPTGEEKESGVNRVEIKIVWKDNLTAYLDWTNTNLAANYSWWDYPFEPPNEANFTMYIAITRLK